MNAMTSMPRSTRGATLAMLLIFGSLPLASCSITVNNQPDTASESADAAKKPKKKKKAKPEKAPEKVAEKPAAKPEKKPAAKPAKKPEKVADKPAKPEPKPAPKPVVVEKPAAPKPAPKPPIEVAAQEPSKPKVTQIVVPVRIAFDEAVAKIDALIEKTAKQDWKQVSDPGDFPKVEVKYKVWRDPLKIKLDDGTLKVSVDVHYAADVRASTKNPLGGTLWITKGETWGTKSEPQELTAKFHAKLSIADDFDVKASAKLDDIEHGKAPSGDVCVKAIAKVCISKESIAPKVRKNLEGYLVPRIEKALKKVDSEIEKALRLKKHAEKLWSALQKPQPLQKLGQASCPTEVGSVCSTPAWLVAQPTSLGVSQPRMDGKDLRVDLAVTGNLLVQLGEAPKVKPIALPNLSAVTGPAGFVVHAQLRIAVPALSEELNDRVKDEHLGGKGAPEIVVNGVKIVDDFDAKHPQRIVVSIKVSGALDAELKLQGDLSYDKKKGELSVKSFDYTLDTGNAQLAQLSAANHKALRELIEDKAHWKIDTRAATLSKAVTIALGGVWRDHLKVEGELEDIQLERFEMKKNTLEADITLGGQLGLTFKP